MAGSAAFYQPLQKELGLPTGFKCAYAMMLAHPKYVAHAIPRLNPLQVTWQ